MKFKKLKIKEFKMFKEKEICFNEDLTIIAGRNGSGKTTIFNLMKQLYETKEIKCCSLETEGKKTTDKSENVFFDKPTDLDAKETMSSLIDTLAMRERQNVQDPFILDCPFSALDEGQTKILMKLFSNLDHQVIVFHTGELLDYKADYELVDNQ